MHKLRSELTSRGFAQTGKVRHYSNAPHVMGCRREYLFGIGQPAEHKTRSRADRAFKRGTIGVVPRWPGAPNECLLRGRAKSWLLSVTGFPVSFRPALGEFTAVGWPRSIGKFR